MAGMPVAARLAIAIRDGRGRLPVPARRPGGQRAERAEHDAHRRSVALSREHHADLDLLVVVDGGRERLLRLLAVVGRHREQERPAHERPVERVQRA